VLAGVHEGVSRHEVHVQAARQVIHLVEQRPREETPAAMRPPSPAEVLRPDGDVVRSGDLRKQVRHRQACLPVDLLIALALEGGVDEDCEPALDLDHRHRHRFANLRRREAEPPGAMHRRDQVVHEPVDCRIGHPDRTGDRPKASVGHHENRRRRSRAVRSRVGHQRPRTRPPCLGQRDAGSATAVSPAGPGATL